MSTQAPARRSSFIRLFAAAAFLATAIPAYAQHTWTARDSNRRWTSIASSGDGTKVVAVGGDITDTAKPKLYRSMDSGATWAPLTGASDQTWVSIASSADGTKLVACEQSSDTATFAGGRIWTSTNAGVNWTSRTSAGIDAWTAVACSADGTKLVAIVNGGQIHISTDSGATWQASSTVSGNASATRGWGAVAISPNGNLIVAADNSGPAFTGGRIYSSSNDGGNWTQLTAPLASWIAVASSADGSRLVAAAYDGGVHLSTDSGTTWTPQTMPTNLSKWGAVAMSSDGTHIVAADGWWYDEGALHTTANTGSTWTVQTGAGNRKWAAVTSSADGNKLVAGTFGGQIHTGVAAVAPTVTTTTQASVTATTAVLGGNVTSDGGAAVTDRGIVWATTANPTTANTKVANGTGTGAFSATVSGLPSNAAIHVRAYATNSIATSYGSEITFSTPPANSAPVNTVPLAQTVNEDTALAITGLSVNDTNGNLSSTALSVSHGTLTVSLAGGATISAGANASATLTLSGTQPQINAALGTMSYTGVLNYNGPDTLTVLSTDSLAATDSDTVDITVTPLNAAPSFTKGENQSVLEDAVFQSVFGWAKNISAGPPDESAQTVSFTITGNTNPALFSAEPAVAEDGTLTYTPAADAFGTATISLKAVDNGNPSAESAVQTFTITITPVNDAPSFTIGANQTAPEDAGQQTVLHWATKISAGPGETDQSVRFDVINISNTTLLSTAPAVDSDGTLTYTPAANAWGTATFQLAAVDNATLQRASNLQTFTITIRPVNDPPSIHYTPDAEYPPGNPSKPFEFNIKCNLSPGPGDSATACNFEFSNDNLELFRIVYLEKNGDFHFEVAPGNFGVANVTVTVTEKVNPPSSATQTFQIIVPGPNCPTNTAATPPPASTQSVSSLSLGQRMAAKAASTISLATYHALEDLLGESEQGRRLKNLYWAHGTEINEIIKAQPALRSKMAGLLTTFQPLVQALLTGKGKNVRITQAMIDDLNSMCDTLLTYASPSLKATVKNERTRFHGFKDFVGRDFTQWATMLAVPVPAANPAFRTVKWNGDADSGIDATRGTLWARRFGTATNATINGVTLTGTGFVIKSPEFDLSGLTLNYNTNDVNQLTGLTGQGSAEVAKRFSYGGNPGRLTFKQLTPGHKYTASLFTVGFDTTPGIRVQTFSSGTDSQTLDPNVYGDNAGCRIDYTFTADAATRTLTITPPNANHTFGLYAVALRRETLLPPAMTGASVASITTSGAKLKATATSNDARAPITRRGFVIAPTATNPAPALGGKGVKDLPVAGTSGAFSTVLNTLLPGTKYSFKAYAENEGGISYTSPVSTFTTLARKPTVTTPTKTAITPSGARLGGKVTSDGGAKITSLGVVYSISSKNSNPLIGGTGVTRKTSTGTTGVFAVTLTDLKPGTRYSFKAFATNSKGTTYTSPVSTFTTPAASAAIQSSPWMDAARKPAADTWKTLTTIDAEHGVKYLSLVITKPPGTEHRPRIVEVSSNLTDWFSGPRHTTILRDDANFLKVRDNTPLVPGTKRYIRLKP